jgi:hypothetical protein
MFVTPRSRLEPIDLQEYWRMSVAKVLAMELAHSAGLAKKSRRELHL